MWASDGVGCFHSKSHLVSEKHYRVTHMSNFHYCSPYLVSELQDTLPCVLIMHMNFVLCTHISQEQIMVNVCHAMI